MTGGRSAAEVVAVGSLPHPTFDRLHTRLFAAGFTLALLSFGGLLWMGDDARGGWAGAAAGVAFASGVLLPWVAPHDRTRCPRCGAPLARAVGEAAFVCPSCRVSWETRWTTGG